ncbi:MAG: SRPBCC family protein [Trebonia sp.]
MPPRKNNGNGPVDRLKDEASGLVGALADRAFTSVTHKVEGAAGRLSDYVEGPGGPGLMAAVTGAKSMAEGDGPGKAVVKAGMTGLKEKVKGIFRNGKSGGKQKLKLTNIVESVDVGVPVRLAYNQWTSYEDFPTFTKKVENASPDGNDQEYKVNWKAQIFWSHREWEATVVDQRPDERIVWKSEGQKGHVDGLVTFHELAPNLTKIVLVMEYHPQGMFEHTANLWRAQGRRTRLELKHFQRHVMAHALLNPDDVEGWRGVIEDGQIVKDHETALEEEGRERDEAPTDETAGEAAEDESADDEFADEADEEEDTAEAPSDEEEDADGERPSGRRRAPARGGSRGRAPQRAREGATRGSR